MSVLHISLFVFIALLNLKSCLFHRGDNDDVMTETDWPDRFVPTLGLGDLTGEYNVLFVMLQCHNVH